MKKKTGFQKFLIWFGIILLILVIAGVCIIFIPQAVSNHKTKKFFTSPNGELETSQKEYLNEMKNEISDIEGYTKYDKYKKGLEMYDGSDTDNDGLTDKEEIEIYGSDPLKASTAGDLYFDSYKVANDLDVNTYYEYNGSTNSTYNECEEVLLEAVEPTDLMATVKDASSYSVVGGFDALKAYYIYNFGGNMQIDCTKVDGVTSEKAEVMVSVDGNDAKKCKTEVNNGNLVIKEEFDKNSTYYIYIGKKVKSGLLGGVMDVDGVVTDVATKSDATKVALVVGSGIKELMDESSTIYYADLNDDDKNNTLLQSIVDKENALHGVTVSSMDNPENIQENILMVNARYRAMQLALSAFEIQGPVLSEFYHDNGLPKVKKAFFYFYAVDAEDAGIYVSELQKRLVNGENVDWQLPFQNFGTSVNEAGMCMGIARLTSDLYNGVKVSESGSYNFGSDKDTAGNSIGSRSWNLSAYPDSASVLTTPGHLSEYKDANWVDDNGVSKIINDSVLSDEEQQFVHMIECMWQEENDRFDIRDYERYIDGRYPYAMIEAVKEKLDEGQMLDMTMLLADDSCAHTVNVYDYYEDPEKEDVTHFMVYDSNYPINYANAHGGVDFSDLVCELVVTRLKAAREGAEDTFSYTYVSKSSDKDDYASSALTNRKNGTKYSWYSLVFVDKDRHIINDDFMTAFDREYTEELDSGDVNLDEVSEEQKRKNREYLAKLMQENGGYEETSGYTSFYSNTDDVDAYWEGLKVIHGINTTKSEDKAIKNYCEAAMATVIAEVYEERNSRASDFITDWVGKKVLGSLLSKTKIKLPTLNSKVDVYTQQVHFKYGKYQITEVVNVIVPCLEGEDYYYAFASISFFDDNNQMLNDPQTIAVYSNISTYHLYCQIVTATKNCRNKSFTELTGIDVKDLAKQEVKKDITKKLKQNDFDYFAAIINQL